MSEALPEALPEVLQSEGDASFVDALFADLGALAKVLSVRIKGGAEAYSSDAPDLRAAHAALRAGAPAVQLAYVHDGAVWTDTVLRVGADAFRVVRMRAPAAA